MTGAGFAARGTLSVGLAALVFSIGCNSDPGESGPSASASSDTNGSVLGDAGVKSDVGSPAPRVCEPGARQCASDSSDIAQCNESGTAWAKTGTCTAQQACVDSACVEASTTLGEVKVLGPAENMQEVALAPGKYGLAVVNNVIATNARELPFPVQISGELRGSDTPAAHPRLHPLPLLVDHASRWQRHPGERAFAARSSARPRLYRYQLGDQRVFNFHDPTNEDSVANKRTGVLRYSGTSVNVWEDVTTGATGSVINDSCLNELVRRIDTAAVPRDIAIFGAPSDVDGNRRIDLFFTPLLPVGDFGAFINTHTFYPPGFLPDFDSGEIMYLQGENAMSAIAPLAGLIAHEITHLIAFGVALRPFLDPPREATITWHDDAIYLEEGLAGLAELLAGQRPQARVAWALTHPELWTLGHLFDTAYATDHDRNITYYGEAALLFAYLFEQAGGAEITSPASVTDRGGLAFLKQFIEGQAGRAGLTLPDGRGVQQTYVDMVAALLRAAFAEYLPLPSGDQPVRYAFQPVRRDPVFGGTIGVPLRFEDYVAGAEPMPLPVRTDWSEHLSTLLEGGVAFHELVVGPGGAALRNTDANTHVVLLRYADLK